MGATVAVAACTTEDGSGFYPDPDWPLLRTALGDVAIEARQVAWVDPAVAWETFDLVVIRSTWDSVDRPEEYLAWVTAVSKLTRLANPADVVSWNLDKHYLAELSDGGIDVVPTTWIEPTDTWDFPQGAFVVKPAISAGGRETARYDDGDAGPATAHVRRLQDRGQTVMVQPYIAAVDAIGETKVVFVDGRLSHAVQVGALLEPGAGVMDQPWEKPVTVVPVSPSRRQRQLAESAMSFVRDRFGQAPLYGRVDIVDGDDGTPMVGEVELIDPVLSLWADAAAAPSLATAISNLVTPT